MINRKWEVIIHGREKIMIGVKDTAIKNILELFTKKMLDEKTKKIIDDMVKRGNGKWRDEQSSLEEFKLELKNMTEDELRLFVPNVFRKIFIKLTMKDYGMKELSCYLMI